MHGHGRGTLGAALRVGAVLLVAAAVPTTTAMAAVSPAPPSTEELISATNAMLRPSDVPASMATPQRPFDTTGFTIPPGGDDPMPVCIYSARRDVVLPPAAGAIGYSARSGLLTQDVYDYGSVDAMESAWVALTNEIGKRCRGSFSQGGERTSITSVEISSGASGVSGWAVETSSATGGQYSVVLPVGTAISMVSYVRDDRAPAASSLRTVQRLADSLAVRWRDRATSPLTQPSLITDAEQAMLTAADVPGALPVTPLGRGGSPSFQAIAPGLGPNTCWSPARIPAGARGFTSFLGGGTGQSSGTGVLGQQVEAYASAADARRAWERLIPAVARCGKQPLTPKAAQPPLTKSSSGVSSMVFDGVPAMWSRTWDRWYDGADSFSTKSYTAYLLVGSTVQSVTYSTSRDGIRQVPLDQVAVNSLAEDLALRWLGSDGG